MDELLKEADVRAENAVEEFKYRFTAMIKTSYSELLKGIKFQLETNLQSVIVHAESIDNNLTLEISKLSSSILHNKTDVALITKFE